MTSNREPLVTDYETAHGKPDNRAAVDACKVFILGYLDTNATLTMHEFYVDQVFQPRDGDMYDAFSELVRAGRIVGSDPHNPEHQQHNDHQDYVYRARKD